MEKKKKYTVTVCRIGYSYHDFEVEAENMDEADKLALAQAGNVEFSEKTADYEVQSTQQID